jgi:hypothetical protein
MQRGRAAGHCAGRLENDLTARRAYDNLASASSARALKTDDTAPEGQRHEPQFPLPYRLDHTSDCRLEPALGVKAPSSWRMRMISSFVAKCRYHASKAAFASSVVAVDHRCRRRRARHAPEGPAPVRTWQQCSKSS